ncbi:hypothetical protein RHGRI_015974 [Rhododendron griersonianum]|uniref:Uncharacterized protein n=1 Tax=Rhododendron griersonianum TaxID=479676 RepID=A0AAV6JTD6_9ERIC|nr:hypothetical protein RHGRI_015974 [Rhododendron griersonianum]
MLCGIDTKAVEEEEEEEEEKGRARWLGECEHPRVSEGRRRRLSHALPPPLILPQADDLSTPSICLLLLSPFTKILICVAEPPDLSICVPLVCSPSFCMFLFVVDLCFVIPPSFCVSLSSLIAVYAVVLCASLFLTSASSDPLLPQDLCQSAADLSSHSSVPYKPLLRLLSGSDFIFTCPKPREKSEELKVRLRKLEELAERKEYEELVKDITQSKGTDELFSSYNDQLGFAISSALFDYGRELWCQISMVGLIYRSCFSFSLSCFSFTEIAREANAFIDLPADAFIWIGSVLGFGGQGWVSSYGSLFREGGSRGEGGFGDLQENNLTGQISDEIGNCVSLILLLGLSTNLLHGGIPFSISKLKQLELLNLKNNQLTCPIPSTLTQIANLKTPGNQCVRLLITRLLFGPSEDEQFESDEAQVVKEIAALEPQVRP